MKIILLIVVGLLSISVLLSTVIAIKNTKNTEIGFRNITPAEAKERLASEPEIVLLDVRTPEEYAERHIPYSILIPVDRLEQEAEGKLTNKKVTIFVYCRSGRRSVIAARILVKLGYTDVYNLGGIINWSYDTESSK